MSFQSVIWLGRCVLALTCFACPVQQARLYPAARQLQSSRHDSLPQPLKVFSKLLAACNNPAAGWQVTGHLCNSALDSAPLASGAIRRQGNARMQMHIKDWKTRHSEAKRRPGDWDCKKCGAGPVFASRMECHVCGAPKPDLEMLKRGEEEVEDAVLGNSFRRIEYAIEGEWDCTLCGARKNFAHRSTCYRCKAPKHLSLGTQPDQVVVARCLVGNLAENIDSNALKNAFVKEGYPVVQASIEIARYTGKSKGKGIVELETEHAAQHAADEMAGFEIDGRPITIQLDSKAIKEREREQQRMEEEMLGATPMTLQSRGRSDEYEFDEEEEEEEGEEDDFWESLHKERDRERQEFEQLRAQETHTDEDEELVRGKEARLDGRSSSISSSSSSSSSDEKLDWEAELDAIVSGPSERDIVQEWKVRQQTDWKARQAEFERQQAEREAEWRARQEMMMTDRQRRKRAFFEKQRQQRDVGVEPYDPNKLQEWRRTLGSEDGTEYGQVEEEKVVKLLTRRDQARQNQNFHYADKLVKQLADMRVSFDDNKRQRIWWFGRRADGRPVGGRGWAELQAKIRERREEGLRGEDDDSDDGFQAKIQRWRQGNENFSDEDKLKDEDEDEDAGYHQTLSQKLRSGKPDRDRHKLGDVDWDDYEDDLVTQWHDEQHDDEFGVEEQDDDEDWDSDEEDDDWDDAPGWDSDEEDDDWDDSPGGRGGGRSERGPPSKKLRGAAPALA